MYTGRLYTRDIKVLYSPGSDLCIQVDYLPGISRFYILQDQINVSRKIIYQGYQGSISSRFRSMYPGRLYQRTRSKFSSLTFFFIMLTCKKKRKEKKFFDFLNKNLHPVELISTHPTDQSIYQILMKR